MGTVRISEIANELGYNSKEVLEKAIELGLKVKTHSSGVSPEEAAKLSKKNRKRKNRPSKRRKPKRAKRKKKANLKRPKNQAPQKKKSLCRKKK